jgi:hypothetical protein
MPPLMCVPGSLIGCDKPQLRGSCKGTPGAWRYDEIAAALDTPNLEHACRSVCVFLAAGCDPRFHNIGCIRHSNACSVSKQSVNHFLLQQGFWTRSYTRDDFSPPYYTAQRLSRSALSRLCGAQLFILLVCEAGVSKTQHSLADHL